MIIIKYITDKYNDVCINITDKGFAVEIEKKDFTELVRYDFPDKLLFLVGSVVKLGDIVKVRL